MANHSTRTAIVTGASKRVGRAIAEALLADGWAVVAHVHHDGDDVPQGAVAVVADLADSDCAARIFGLVVNLLDSKLNALNADFFSYTLSKIALAGLTELSARSLAAKRIRVNAIAPGLMLRSDGQDDANFGAMHHFNPLQRGVEPSDVVDALRYFIGATAVTGQTITIDGGQRFWALERDVQFLENQ